MGSSPRILSNKSGFPLLFFCQKNKNKKTPSVNSTHKLWRIYLTDFSFSLRQTVCRAFIPVAGPQEVKGFIEELYDSGFSYLRNRQTVLALSEDKYFGFIRLEITVIASTFFQEVPYNKVFREIVFQGVMRTVLKKLFKKEKRKRKIIGAILRKLSEKMKKTISKNHFRWIDFFFFFAKIANFLQIGTS